MNEPMSIKGTVFDPITPRGHGSRLGRLPKDAPDKRRHVACVMGCQADRDGVVQHKDTIRKG